MTVLARLRRLAVIAVVVCVVAPACAGPRVHGRYWGRVDPPAGQELRYISGPEPESLDPQRSSGQPEARIYLALFDGLTENDPKTAEPIPSLAERWDVNADNSEFVFHLRHGVRWSDGSPLTADDFVYTFRRALSPELAARSAYMAYDIQYAEGYNEGGVFARDPGTGAFVMDPAKPWLRLVLPGDVGERARALAEAALAAARGKTFVPVRAEDIGVEALDADTLCVHLKGPTPFFLGLMTYQLFRPVPRQAIERDGDAWTQPEHIVTSGAFRLAEWRPYDRIIVTRNPTYWDASVVRLDRITFYPLEDYTTMMNLYKAGAVDAVFNHTVPLGWVDEIRAYDDYMDAPEDANEYYEINTTRPPMNDVRVRKAFNMAIDKNALASFRRTAKPLTSFVPVGIFPDYPSPAGDPFDPVKARALLAAAGYRDASGAFDPSRFPMADVEMIYNTAETNRQTAEFVQAQWKQNLGLTVPLRNVEWKTFLDQRAKLNYKGLARGAWVGDYLDPFTFLNLFYTVGGDNGTGWWDPKYVAMLDAANREHDPRARDVLLANAEQYLLDAQPIISLFDTSTNWLKKPYVKGMYANPATMHAWKYVYIEHDPAKWDERAPAAAH